jgi:hypothetical protein
LLSIDGHLNGHAPPAFSYAPAPIKALVNLPLSTYYYPAGDPLVRWLQRLDLFPHLHVIDILNPHLLKNLPNNTPIPVKAKKSKRGSKAEVLEDEKLFGDAKEIEKKVDEWKAEAGIEDINAVAKTSVRPRKRVSLRFGPSQSSRAGKRGMRGMRTAV